MKTGTRWLPTSLCRACGYRLAIIQPATSDGVGHWCSVCCQIALPPIEGFPGAPGTLDP